MLLVEDHILSMRKSPVHCRNLKVGRCQSARVSAHGHAVNLGIREPLPITRGVRA